MSWNVEQILPEADFFKPSKDLLFTATETFPDTVPLENKLVIYQGRYREPQSESLTRLGVHCVHENKDSNPKRAGYSTFGVIGDAELNGLAGRNGGHNFKHWACNFDPEMVANKVIEQISGMLLAHKYLMINGEFWGDKDFTNNSFNWNGNANEVRRKIGQKAKAMPGAAYLAWWANGKHSFNNWSFEQNHDALANQYNLPNILHQNDPTFEFYTASEQMAYGMQLRPEKESLLSLHISEVNRISDPNTLYLETVWQQIETVDSMKSTIFCVDAGDKILRIDEKPMSSPCRMWNKAIRATTIQQAISVWDWLAANNDPTTYVYGASDGSFRYGNNQSVYATKWQGALDYFFLGLFHTGKAGRREIIESQGNLRWHMPEYSMDGGQTWITGKFLTPPFCEKDKRPYVRVAYNANATEALIVAEDCFQLGTVVRTIKVRDVAKNMNADIILEGNWISFNKLFKI